MILFKSDNYLGRKELLGELGRGRRGRCLSATLDGIRPVGVSAFPGLSGAAGSKPRPPRNGLERPPWPFGSPGEDPEAGVGVFPLPLCRWTSGKSNRVSTLRELRDKNKEIQGRPFCPSSERAHTQTNGQRLLPGKRERVTSQPLCRPQER